MTETKQIVAMWAVREIGTNNFIPNIRARQRVAQTSLDLKPNGGPLGPKLFTNARFALTAITYWKRGRCRATGVEDSALEYEPIPERENRQLIPVRVLLMEELSYG